VGTIGFSRLYLGAHYLSDVLAGVCLGAGWLFAWLIVFELSEGRDLVSRLPPWLRRVFERLAGPTSRSL
jgi:membrane-associated phospholipid phosphatase